jgi:hypothetical protein
MRFHLCVLDLRPMCELCGRGGLCRRSAVAATRSRSFAGAQLCDRDRLSGSRIDLSALPSSGKRPHVSDSANLYLMANQPLEPTGLSSVLVRKVANGRRSLVPLAHL